MKFDVLVIGGGHAGVEAAVVSARMGLTVGLVTFDRNAIGAMSCNPAIGGLGKGHLVREIDALDGIAAKAADFAAIHYRMLNRSKGSAVWGPRVQADRRLFRKAVQNSIFHHPKITIIEGEVVDLVTKGEIAAGVVLADQTSLASSAVILCTGTFLGGTMFRGNEKVHGGRTGEAGAQRLSARLRDRNLPIARMKTGTPPRIDGRTIDWACLEEQPSDGETWTFSSLSHSRANPQLSCAITRTNPKTHDIVRANLAKSPMFTGAINADGPRYCPSIEDKVVRFGDRDGHQIFLEPEGLDTHLVYPNGISTSLPPDVQNDMVHSMSGLEQARIEAPGYAVEYDHVDPRSLDDGLQLMAFPGLYSAGQINGTTGYEEAAAQGLWAGLSASCAVQGRKRPLLDRSNSYIAVMVDDLTLQGVTEPYRMLTSRAEYRLRLRAANADTRLTPVGLDVGCITSERAEWFAKRQDHRERLQRGEFPKTDDYAFDVSIVIEDAEDRLYAPYIARQEREIDDVRASGNVFLGSDFSYADVPGLSNEMVSRLQASKPDTLGAAARIRGITPAGLAAVLVHARKMSQPA